MRGTKPLAGLSLDLDNQWSYMKTHGDPGWQSFPSYLDVVVPRVLDFLAERNLLITFFVVGQDAVLRRNHEALGALARAGHEIGNHSFHHEPWLHLYSDSEVRGEIARAEDAIEQATGKKPQGFRGPGFSHSRSTLKVLAERGYLYDASTFPTYLGPLARAYYFMTAQLSAQEKTQRKQLFGSIRDGLQPLKPYRWQLDDNLELLELPVTTMPVFKLPFHVSYLLYLGSFSTRAAIQYFRGALRLCRWTDTPVSLLLHPLDFLGCDDASALSFFPAMRIPSSQKLELLDEILRIYAGEFDVVNMERYAREALSSANLPVMTPALERARGPA